ncbi:MAG: hypothetical protein AB7U85_00530 [Alphaproteobacteria bacterium]
MQNQKLEDIQANIYDFLDKANKVLLKEDSLFYGGQYITGCLENPKILFIGINPGFAANDEWGDRPHTFNRKTFSQKDCKYIEEAKRKNSLALKVVEYLLNNENDLLKKCAETSFKSFFATSNENGIDGSLKNLSSSGLQVEHHKIMNDAIKTIIEEISPENIVFIGKTVFDNFVCTFGCKKTEIKEMTSLSGKTKRIFYQKTFFNGIPTHGVLHLSGAQPSTKILDELKNIFKSVIS